jgi:hypothetical protein
MPRVGITEINKRVKEISEDHYPHFPLDKSTRLSRFHFYLQTFLGAEDVNDGDIFEQVVDDGPDEGIDFFFLSKQDGRPLLYCVQAKDHTSFPKSEQKAAITKMIHEVKRLRETKVSTGLHERARERMQSLRESEATGELTIRFMLFLTGGAKAKLSPNSDLAAGDLLDSATVKIYDQEELIHELNREEQEVKPSVSFSWSADSFYEVSEPLRVIQGVMPVSEFISRTKPFGKDIFRLNPRLYLATRRGGPNSRMLESLNSQESEIFHILNNGVTAVCESFDLSTARSGMATINVTDFQIVNGCQTTSTLWRWADDEPVDIEKVYVTVKLIESKELADRISETTNSQTSITFVDLKANSDTQLKVKRALEQLDYCPYVYINKRGTWESKENRAKYLVKNWGVVKGTHYRKIDIRELAQTLVAVTGKPHRAKENLIDIFNSEEAYMGLFDKTWESGDQLGLVADVYLYSSNFGVWATKSDETSKKNFSTLARYYVCYLVYEFLRSNGEPTQLFVGSETGQPLIPAERSRAIRENFVENVSNVAALALEAVDAVWLNRQSLPGAPDKRAIVRKEDYKREIENEFRSALRYSKKS